MVKRIRNDSFGEFRIDNKKVVLYPNHLPGGDGADVYTVHTAVCREELAQLIQTHRNSVALIVGPTDLISCKSILQDCIMDDFTFELPPKIDIMPNSVTRLPYYAYYPFFMMEEENSQYFYFRHQVPGNDESWSGLTVYFLTGQ